MKGTEILVIEGNEKYFDELREVLSKSAPETLDVTFIVTKETADLYLEMEEDDRKNIALVVIDPQTAPSNGSDLFQLFSETYKDRLVVYTANDSIVDTAVAQSIQAASKKKDRRYLEEAIEKILYQ